MTHPTRLTSYHLTSRFRCAFPIWRIPKLIRLPYRTRFGSATQRGVARSGLTQKCLCVDGQID